MTAKQHALYLINRREYGKDELIENLVRKGHEEKDVIDAVNHLSEIDIQSDKRALQTTISLGISRKDGPHKVMAKLRQKKLNAEENKNSAEDILEQIDFEGQAKELVERKYGKGPFDRDKKRKITNHLLGKGYTLQQALKATEQNDDDNFDDNSTEEY